MIFLSCYLLLTMLRFAASFTTSAREGKDAGQDALVLERAQVERRQLVVQLERVVRDLLGLLDIIIELLVAGHLGREGRARPWSEILWLYFAISSRVRFWSFAM